MTRAHEKLLVGVLAGIIIAGAAAFAIEPAMSSGHAAASTPVPSSQLLTLRLTSKA